MFSIQSLVNGQLPPELASRLTTLINGLAADPNATPMVSKGVIPSARLHFSAIPTDTNTVTIGGHVFKFLTVLVAANTFTQVKRLGSAALTLAAFIDAINGVANANVVQATTPFAKSIVADAPVATALRIRLASARGGLPITGVSDSIALSETLADVTDIWNCGNLNVSGQTDAAPQQYTPTKIAITAEMITAGSFDTELAFTPGQMQVTVMSATGAVLVTDDLITISGSHVHIALAGGVAPNLQATDEVHITAMT